jgi:hypothetical protein
MWNDVDILEILSREDLVSFLVNVPPVLSLLLSLSLSFFLFLLFDDFFLNLTHEFFELRVNLC